MQVFVSVALCTSGGNTWLTIWCCNTLLQHQSQFDTWAARYNTWILIKLTPKGVVFSFLFDAFAQHSASLVVRNLGGRVIFNERCKKGTSRFASVGHECADSQAEDYHTACQ